MREPRVAGEAIGCMPTQKSKPHSGVTTRSSKCRVAASYHGCREHIVNMPYAASRRAGSMRVAHIGT